MSRGQLSPQSQHSLAASAHCATPDTCPGPAVRNNGQTLVTSADYYESTAFTSGVLSKEPVPGSSKSTRKLQRGIVCDARLQRVTTGQGPQMWGRGG